MTRSELLQLIQDLLIFMDADAPFLMPLNQRDLFKQGALELQEKARKPGEVLYVGILGGTGVGKSTLINALAKQEISHASDRRPFTEKAVVYRHKDTPRGLDEVSDLIRDSDALHSADAIKDLVLLDLPDFDSILQDHRRTVLRILPFLDAIIWVVSPEKYADESFYSLLQETAVHRENFTFILNKADELITDEDRDPYTKLKDVLGDFAFRLKHHNGIDQPRIFSLSALYEFTGNENQQFLKNEFVKFRDFLITKRTAKEIASTKTMNLLEKTRFLIQEVNKAINPQDKARIVTSIRKIPLEKGENAIPGSDMAEAEKKFSEIIHSRLIWEDNPIAPIRLALKILNWGKPAYKVLSDEQIKEAFCDIAGLLTKDSIADLGKIHSRMSSEFLFSFSGAEVAEVAKDGESPEDYIKEATNKAFSFFRLMFAKTRSSFEGLFAGWRRLIQKLVLLAPVVILILKLMGQRNVTEFINSPTFSGWAILILNFLMAIFSSEGLIGLAALAICEIVLVFFLAARQSRKLERLARNLSRSAIRELKRSINGVADEMRAAWIERLDNIENSLARLHRLSSPLISNTQDQDFLEQWKLQSS